MSEIVSTQKPDPLLHFIRKIVSIEETSRLSDRELMQRFVAHHDEAAIATLIKRHGPMVMGVCRRVLHRSADVEDAFQATWMVLIRKAAEMPWRNSVAGFLHDVAHNTAVNAKVAAARRRGREEKAHTAQAADPFAEVTGRELLAALDEELARLPDRYRSVLLLCYLEGKSRDEAARQLSCPLATLKSRLQRGRDLLRRALARRGLTLSTGLLAAALEENAVHGALPPELTHATIKAAVQSTTGPGTTAGVFSGCFATFLRGVMKAMMGAKMKLKITAVLALVSTALAGWAMTGSWSSGETTSAQFASVDSDTAAPARPGEREESYGGTVRDATTGKPVSGVKVVVRKFANGKPAGKAEFTSDAGGRFRILLPAAWASAPEAQLSVDLEAPRGYVAFPYRDEMGATTESGVLLGDLRWQQELGVPPYFDRMLLFPITELRGRLETPNGRPAVGVDVVACSMPLKDKAFHRVVRRTKTDSEGRFTVEAASPGRVVLYFLPEHDAARYVKLNNAQGDLGTYKLEKGVEVTGKLMDVRNQPLPGRWVRIGTSAGPEANDQHLHQVGLDGFARWSKTGPDGTFRTAPLPAGEYEVSAHGIDRRAGIDESHHGGNPSWDALAGRERIGEPLEACIVPQKVVVGKDKAPQMVLQAVPHVNITIQATDSEGRKSKVGFRALYRYEFDGREYFTYYGFVEMPTAKDGRIVIRVPHGTNRFDGFLIARGVLCRIQNAEKKLHALGPNYVTLLDVDADKTIECVCRPCLNASLKLSSKEEFPLTEVAIDVRHGQEVCYMAQVGDGTYWITGIQPNRRLSIEVKAKGCETVHKEVSVANGSPGRLELVLEKKK